ncbi:hypothetical protein [Bacillus massilioanorexius]|uniref:hypothetical protein n=1 Tax=Bacillus TaxID=1386 RepID=UPI00031505B3
MNAQLVSYDSYYPTGFYEDMRIRPEFGGRPGWEWDQSRWGFGGFGLPFLGGLAIGTLLAGPLGAYGGYPYPYSYPYYYGTPYVY